MVDYNIESYKPVPIQLEWKVSAEDLDDLTTGGEWDLKRNDISHKMVIKEFRKIKYGLKICEERKYIDEEFISKSVFKLALVLYGVEEEEHDYHAQFAFYIKSAGFETEYETALYASLDSDKVYYDSNDEPIYTGWCREIGTRDELFDPSKKFIVDGNMVVEMKGMVYAKIKSDCFEEEPQTTLGDYLWRNDHYFDFVIVAGKEDDKENKTEIKIHKCVLGSRSFYFDAIFTTNMKEKTENKVEITDFDAKIVQAAVEYCYDQSITDFLNDLTDALTLLQFSDKCDIKDLKYDVEVHVIKEALTPKTVAQIANGAILSNSSKLRDFCLRAMVIYMRQGISVENFDGLDEDFSKELCKTAFTFNTS